MGLSIALLDCNGQILDRVDDPKNVLHSLLPSADEESDSLLTKIDWYGDTFFNYLQMKQFLVEWDQLAHRAQTPAEQALASGIRSLAVRCQNERDVLRFIGD